MTISEMHTAIKQHLDKTSALELPVFEPVEIDFWLNDAIRKFVKTRYSGMNTKRESFEETQKRTDDLRTLIKNFTETHTGLGSFPNSSYYYLPVEGSSYGSEDYWFALQEEATISVGGTETRVGITECTLDEYKQKLDDPFSEHKLHYGTAKPLRIFMGVQVNLIYDTGYTVTDYHLTYLRKPATVKVTATAVNCDLPEHTHDEVVKMAASMMLENIEQPRYQSHMNEVNTME